MENGVLTEDVQFANLFMTAKVLIVNSVNGNKVRVYSSGYTSNNYLPNNGKRTNGE